MNSYDITEEELIQMEQEHYASIATEPQPPFSPEHDAEMQAYLESIDQTPPMLDGTEELYANETLDDDFYDHEEEDWSLWVAPPSPVYSDASNYPGTAACPHKDYQPFTKKPSNQDQ